MCVCVCTFLGRLLSLLPSGVRSVMQVAVQPLIVVSGIPCRRVLPLPLDPTSYTQQARNLSSSPGRSQDSSPARESRKFLELRPRGVNLDAGLEKIAAKNRLRARAKLVCVCVCVFVLCTMENCLCACACVWCTFIFVQHTRIMVCAFVCVHVCMNVRTYVCMLV